MNVPCSSMELPIFDNITKIGANDSLLKGKSTFMAELRETSNILNKCTKDSFIIIDELGRGTSTKDGEAIATAVLDFLKTKSSYTLFSTHYHKLVSSYEEVDKLFVKYKENKDDILFLYKMEKGICTDSHGIFVAKMANIPDTILKRTKEIKEELTKSHVFE